ncbi:anti-sigma factor family protein [Rubrolithibacter danxiaensis]|uniref:anti-sigma factor family protein n=1 Tax=Rubrolithibacter danxiaensis TaxID=3390805 RepID=UPI003BF8B4CA
MNILIEQRIWDYLDNNCSPKEREEIQSLIQTDPDYKTVYQELKDINDSLKGVELDEPSMSFTRNVMDKIKTEPVPGSIQSIIDKRIILGITYFFLFTILALLVMLFTQVDWSSNLPEQAGYKLPELQVSDTAKGWLKNAFLFSDIIIGLYFLDNYLRKKLKHEKE